MTFVNSFQRFHVILRTSVTSFQSVIAGERGCLSSQEICGLKCGFGAFWRLKSSNFDIFYGEQKNCEILECRTWSVGTPK